MQAVCVGCVHIGLNYMYMYGEVQYFQLDREKGFKNTYMYIGPIGELEVENIHLCNKILCTCVYTQACREANYFPCLKKKKIILLTFTTTLVSYCISC